jgi:hypothetical protein
VTCIHCRREFAPLRTPALVAVQLRRDLGRALEMAEHGDYARAVGHLSGSIAALTLDLDEVCPLCAIHPAKAEPEPAPGTRP